MKTTRNQGKRRRTQGGNNDKVLYVVNVGLAIEQGEICIPGIYVVKPINCECLTKDQKPAERGAAEDRNSGRTAILASLEPLDGQDFDLWFSIS